MNEQQLNHPATSIEIDQEHSILIDAPPELVFEAWRNPAELTKWWAPEGFNTTVNEFEVRPGGNIRISIKSVDGQEYKQNGHFIEVLYPEKLVFVIDGYDSTGKSHPEIKNTVTIRQEQESSRVIVQVEIHKGTMSATSPAALNGGWTKSLVRLQKNIKQLIEAEPEGNPLTDSDREIRSRRIFNAPRELVFLLWTDAAHLSKWWGPTGFTISTSSFEFKPNGIWEFVMHGPDGVDYRNKIRYQQIKAPERIEYEHLTGPVHRVIVLFEDCGEETQVHFRMIFATTALRNKVASQFGAVEGLEQTLNRLEEMITSK